MSSPPKHPRSATALHGLVILALAAILVDCLFPGNELLENAAVEPAGTCQACVYQVMLDDRCLGTIFRREPEPLSKIVTAMGLARELKEADPSETVPCDRIIKFKSNSPGYSLEKISGPQLVCLGRPIDLNLADECDLVAIPGIGPRLAKKIVDSREASGGFSRVEDLQAIPGIGRKKFARMTPYVEVKPSGSIDKLQYVQAP